MLNFIVKHSVTGDWGGGEGGDAKEQVFFEQALNFVAKIYYNFHLLLTCCG